MYLQLVSAHWVVRLLPRYIKDKNLGNSKLSRFNHFFLVHFLFLGMDHNSQCVSVSVSDRQWCEQVCSLPSFPLSLLPYTAPCSGCTHIQLLLQLLIQLLLPLTACQDCQLQEKCFHRLSWISQGGNVDLIPISDNFGPAGKNTINQLNMSLQFHPFHLVVSYFPADPLLSLSGSAIHSGCLSKSERHSCCLLQTAIRPQTLNLTHPSPLPASMSTIPQVIIVH